MDIFITPERSEFERFSCVAKFNAGSVHFCGLINDWGWLLMALGYEDSPSVDVLCEAVDLFAKTHKYYKVQFIETFLKRGDGNGHNRDSDCS